MPLQLLHKKLSVQLSKSCNCHFVIICHRKLGKDVRLQNMGREEYGKEILILDRCIVYSQLCKYLKNDSETVKSIKGFYLLDC